MQKRRMFRIQVATAAATTATVATATEDETTSGSDGGQLDTQSRPAADSNRSSDVENEIKVIKIVILADCVCAGYMTRCDPLFPPDFS